MSLRNRWGKNIKKNGKPKMQIWGKENRKKKNIERKGQR